MQNSRVQYFLFICLPCLIGIIACGSDKQFSFQRPRDVWALNSVLDQKIRMLSLSLHDNLYVAYQTRPFHLYQVWKGGIHLDGAPFKDIKTLQPTSWGKTYWRDSLAQKVWFVENKDTSYSVAPEYGGYQILSNHQIALQYQIPMPNGSMLEIQEVPEYEEDASGNPLFSQTFYCNPVPPNIRLYYSRLDSRLTFSHHLPDTQRLVQSLPSLPPQQPAPRQVTGNRGKYWMDKSGCNTCHELEEQTIGPGYRQIAERYAEEEGIMDFLISKVKEGGSGNWGEVPMIPHPHLDEGSIRSMLRYILDLDIGKRPKRTGKKAKKQATTPVSFKAGFGAKLDAIHPAYDLSVIRKESFKPRVGAMAFMSDSSLLLTTWDSIGGLYRLYGVTSGDTNQIQIKRIAQGLAEPLGLQVLGEDIFVLQKQELTQLIDHDGDAYIDEYRNICNSWDATTDFHEYSYGLVYKDGTFWANLGLAMRLMPHEEQLPDRGRTIRIHLDGEYEWVNSGLRQANGIGWGPDQELFISENQGKWVPSCKLIHVQQDVFHGCRLGYQMMDNKLLAKSPAVWLPQDDIGNSPGEPMPMHDGPYRDQLLLPEVTHGGIKRIFLEGVQGEFQGCVFRFSQGLGAGVNRLAWGPDGALYTGGVGMNGNWGVPPYQYGLHRLMFNGNIPFEMLEVRAQATGMKIVFTQPLGEGQGEDPRDYLVQQWRYEATAQYGGPKIDQENLSISHLEVSKDRRSVMLHLPEMKTGRIVYIRLSDELKNDEGKGLWSSEVWYTLNALPEGG